MIGGTRERVPRTYTMEQMVDIFHCSPATVKRMLAQGKFRCWKSSSHHILVSAEDVENFFAKPFNRGVV